MRVSRRNFLHRATAAAALGLTREARASIHGSSTAYEGLVASRCRMLNFQNSSTNKQIMMRSAHIESQTLTSIRVCFSDFWNGGAFGPAQVVDVGPGATTAITAAIEYNGSSQQLKFGGSSSGTIPNNGTLWSDYLTVSIPSGATFWVRMFTTCNATGGILYNTWQNSFLGECITLGASGLSDLTLSTGTFTNSQSWSAPPLAIVGMTNSPSMIIVGDSIAAGLQDIEDSSNSAIGFNGKVGTVARSLTCPFVNIARNSATAQGWTTTIAPTADAVIQKASHLFIGLATNDIANSRTPAQIIADYQTIAALAWAKQKSFLGTILPRATDPGTPSTAFTTLNQQTAVGQTTQNSVNTSIRGGIAGTTGNYDLASAFESSQNSDIWRVTPSPPYCGGDGTHPSPANGYPLPVSAGIISPVTWP
jgi:hypothetical protein